MSGPETFVYSIVVGLLVIAIGITLLRRPHPHLSDEHQAGWMSRHVHMPHFGHH